MSMLEVAVIIIGSLIGTAVLFGIVGTLIKCCVHAYKYWCSCLHRRHSRTSSPTPEAEAEEVAVLRNPYFLSGEPTMLVIRALPPNYSTLKITCELAEGQGHQSTTTNSDRNELLRQDIYPLTSFTGHPRSHLNQGHQLRYGQLPGTNYHVTHKNNAAVVSQSSYTNAFNSAKRERASSKGKSPIRHHGTTRVNRVASDDQDVASRSTFSNETILDNPYTDISDIPPPYSSVLTL